MKKIITTCIFAGMVVMSSSAREISESEALRIAQGFMGEKVEQQRAAGRIDLQLSTAYTARSVENENVLYVFNRGENEGFIIVSGDDAVEQPVLGYSDCGSFDYEMMPDGLQWWIGEYANEIALSRRFAASDVSEIRQSLFNKNVGPLVEARWSQDAPYNNMCPEYSGTTRSATGCVATAMAQIMYHHKYPTNGVGSKNVQNGATIETIDFANTTYEWDVMTPLYSSLSTEAECNAVATLMYHVGRSVDMMYGAASGAVSAEAAPALARYFNYDKSIVHRDRNYYTIDEWERFIIDDIDNGRPIMYHGQSNDGGHAFVLDGYNSDGYVHINWGWNGMSNGYFLLHALTPEKQGIGGFSGGYNSGQGAIFGIQPNRGGAATHEITAESIYIENGSYDLGNTISTVVTSIANAYWNNVQCKIGFMLHDENDVVTIIESNDYNFSGSSIKGTINVPLTLPTTLSDGEYKLYLANTISGGEWKHVAMNVNASPYYTVTVDQGKATISSNEGGEIWATSVECNEDVIYSGCFSTFTITVSNTMNHEYFGSLYVSIYESKGKFEQRKSDAIALSIPAGKEVEIEIPIKIEVSKGNYCIFITDGKKNKYSDSYPITVEAEPAMVNFAVSDFRLVKDAKDWLQVEYTITNNGEDYTGYMRPWVLYKNQGSTSSYVNSEEITIKSGESMDFAQEWRFDDGVVGEDYICSLWYYNARIGGVSQLVNENLHFTLSEETALDRVETTQVNLYPNPADEYINITTTHNIDNVTLYSLQGCAVSYINGSGTSMIVDVRSLPQGTYILVVRTSENNITKKITIK